MTPPTKVESIARAVDLLPSADLEVLVAWQVQHLWSAKLRNRETPCRAELVQHGV